MPTDGDIIVPIRTVCVIGTTDVHTDDPDDHRVPENEVDAMLDDGEKLVPGFRQARALRVWTGVRPLFEDAKASDTDTRDVTRAHALLDHAERDGVSGFVTITGGKLTTFRLMAEDTMAAVSRHLGEERPCTTKTEPLPGSEDQATLPRSASGSSRKEAHLADDQLICECEMVPRWKLEEAMQRRATTNLDDIRRLLRLGMGPCQGGFCIYRATGILHGLDGLTAEQADESLLHFLQERWKGVWPILYGDQLRQARLDDWIFQGVLDVEHLPAASEETVRIVRGELHYDAVVIGAGTAGLVAGARLAEGGARVCVLSKGIGSTHLAPGTIDVLGYAPERVSLAARPRSTSSPPSRPDHPYALLGRDAVAEAVRWFSERVAAGPLPGYRYVGDLERNMLLPTAVGALRPSALVPETMAAGDASSTGSATCASSARARCATSTPRCARPTSTGPGSARGRSRSRSRPTEPTRTRSGWRGGSTIPPGARRSPPGWP